MLSYENGPAMMDWLVRAFGFVEKERIIHDGRLAHGELDTGDGRVMLATPSPAYEGPRRHRAHCEVARRWSEVPWVIDGVHVYVDDIDAQFARAQAAGATMLSAIEEGRRGAAFAPTISKATARCSCSDRERERGDLEGHR